MELIPLSLLNSHLIFRSNLPRYLLSQFQRHSKTNIEKILRFEHLCMNFKHRIRICIKQFQLLGLYSLPILLPPYLKLRRVPFLPRNIQECLTISFNDISHSKLEKQKGMSRMPQLWIPLKMLLLAQVKELQYYVQLEHLDSRLLIQIEPLKIHQQFKLL